MMLSWRFLTALLALLLLTATMNAQVNGVKRSTLVEQYKGRPYYLHFVKQGETLTAIARAYAVTVDEILVENPFLQDGLKTDQVIRIPQKPESKGEENVQPVSPNTGEQSKVSRNGTLYRVKSKETLYGISKQFNITVEELMKANPDLTTLKEGMEITIPVAAEVRVSPQQEPAREMPEVTGVYKEIVVQQGQTVYSLSKQYGITVEEFLRLNPEVSGGLKAEQVVKVPVGPGEIVNQKETAKPETRVSGANAPQEKPLPSARCTDPENLKKTYNIALLLPLALEEADSILSQPEGSDLVPDDLKPFHFFQFYAGVLLAADTLEKSGFRARIHVFDADQESDTLKVKKALKKNEMKDMDLIIGPVFVKSFEVASRFAVKHDISIVNPLSRRDRIIENTPVVFKAQVSEEAMAAKLADHICRNHAGTNLVIVRNGTKELAGVYNRFMELLKKSDEYAGFRVREVNYATESFAGVSKNIRADGRNVVLMLSSSRSHVPNFVSMLNNFGKGKELVLIGMPGWESMDIDAELLVNLNYQQLITTFVDYDSEQVKQFVRQFRQQYNVDPSIEEHAFLGFDLGMYFFRALMSYGKDMESCIPEYNYDGLMSDFNFYRDSDTQGFQASYCRIIQIKDYKWTVVH